MFETETERAETVAKIQAKTLNELNIPENRFRQVFYSKRFLRLNDEGWLRFQSTKPFKEVEIDVTSFKMQDLMKISRLNSDLFYIDRKNAKVYTCDNYFVNWCKLNGGNINAIRYSA